MRRSTKALVTAALAAVAAAGCASGGGGGGGPVSPPPTSPPTSPPVSPPPPPPMATPADFETAEYNRDYAKALINASSAYAAGGFGAGVIVAVIDSGLDLDHLEFSQLGKVVAPKDIYDGTEFNPFSFSETIRNSVDTADFHGTAVASIIAAPTLFQGQTGPGFHGVAPEASVMPIRTDAPSDSEDYFNYAIAAAVRYATDNGADIINISLGGDPAQDPVINSALAYATSNGVLIVASAGNDASPGPDNPANFATTAGALGRAVAVGSVGPTSVISGFSNRAAGAETVFLVAPGENVQAALPLDGDAGCIAAGQCYTANGGPGISGTSFSSPQVAGALAVLIDLFPGQTPETYLNRLYATATDLGAPGPDAVYGQGLINLAAASQPLGQTTIAFSPASAALPFEVVAAAPSGATGDWIVASGLLEGALIRDSWNFGFRISPESETARSSLDGAFEAAATTQRIQARAVRTPFGTAAFRAPDDQPIVHENLITDESLTPAMSLSFAQGPYSLAMGRGFSAPAPLSLNETAILTPAAHAGGLAALTSQDGWASVGYEIGAWSFSVRSTGGEARGYSAASLARRFGAHEAGFEVGAAREDELTWGGAISSRLGGEDGADSSFVAAGWSGPIGGNWRGAARLEAAETRLDMPANVQIDADPLASAWSLSAERTVFGGALLGVTLAQPLRAESGRISLLVPVGVTEVNASIFEQRSAALTPSGREIDLETNLRFGLGEGRDATLALRLADDPGHVEDAGMETSVWFGVRVTR